MAGFYQLHIPSSSVTGGAHARFPWLITGANVPAALFDPQSGCQSDGGDIQFFADAAKTQRLAVDLVAISKTSNTLAVYVRLETLPGAGTDLYLSWNAPNAGLNQPAPGQPYSRTDVWADYAAVYHGHGLTNAARADGVGDLTAVGNVSAGDPANATIYQGLATANFDNNSYFEAPGFYPVTGGADRVVSCLVYGRTGRSDRLNLYTYGDTSVPEHFAMDTSTTGGGRLFANNTRLDTVSTAPTGQANHFVARFAGGTTIADASVLFNGVDAGNGGGFQGAPVNTGSSGQGLKIGGGLSFLMEALRIRDANCADYTNDWAATEYANLTNPAGATTLVGPVSASVDLSVSAAPLSIGAGQVPQLVATTHHDVQTPAADILIDIPSGIHVSAPKTVMLPQLTSGVFVHIAGFLTTQLDRRFVAKPTGGARISKPARVSRQTKPRA